MPVRSLNSVVLKWPGREAVLSAARRWAAVLRSHDRTVQQVFCIGSYSRGDWGVGSDVDLIVVLSQSALSPEQRYIHYCPEGLPVPADLRAYTAEEWNALPAESPLLWQRLTRELLPL